MEQITMNSWQPYGDTSPTVTPSGITISDPFGAFSSAEKVKAEREEKKDMTSEFKRLQRAYELSRTAENSRALRAFVQEHGDKWGKLSKRFISSLEDDIRHWDEQDRLDALSDEDYERYLESRTHDEERQDGAIKRAYDAFTALGLDPSVMMSSGVPQGGSAIYNLSRESSERDKGRSDVAEPTSFGIGDLLTTFGFLALALSRVGAPLITASSMAKYKAP